MLKMRVIPCLDVKDGRTVKGVNFVNLVDAGDPVEQAKLYDKAGADELCFLDITASHENRDTLYDVVAKTAPREITPAVQFMPSPEKAVASGSAVPSSFHGSSPVSTMPTRM